MGRHYTFSVSKYNKKRKLKKKQKHFQQQNLKSLPPQLQVNKQTANSAEETSSDPCSSLPPFVDLPVISQTGSECSSGTEKSNTDDKKSENKAEVSASLSSSLSRRLSDKQYYWKFVTDPLVVRLQEYRMLKYRLNKVSL